MYKNILKAHSRIKKHIIKTECFLSKSISELAGTNVYVKYDNKQITGSFKYRGSLNKLLSLKDVQKKNGVVTMSAGNHARGLAMGSKLLDIKATIIMPNNTPFEKIRKNIELGAEVLIKGNNVDEAEKHVDELIKIHNLTKIHPFNDHEVIFGQGTVMLEMLDQCPELDLLIIPVGGGGLISGCSIVAKHLYPNLKIVGAETINFPSLYNLFYKENKDFYFNSVAEGVAVRRIGKLNFPIIKKLVDETLLVKESNIEKAMTFFLLNDKTLVEGAGALGLAAILEHKKLQKYENIGIIACGGNLDSRVLSSLLMRDLTRKKQILTLSIEMEDKPGQLSIISNLCAKEKINILAVEHSRFTLDLSVRAARLNITLETQSKLHAEKIISKIKDLNFRVMEKKTD